MTDLRIREAVRALVIDPHDRVLLVRFDFPARTVWALPGGGIDAGESPHDALRRELVEEIGLHDPEIGPHLWNRLHIFPFLNGFTPQPAFDWEQLNAEYVFELRWWAVEELRVAPVITAPEQLASLVAEFLTRGAPPIPWAVEA